MADISIIHEGNTDYHVKDVAGRLALAEVENKGAKNLLKLGFTHKSAGTQTADMTADGNGIIVNGDRNTTTDTILVYDLVTNKSNMLDTRYTLPAGKYVIPSTGTANLRYQVYCHDGTNYQSLGYTMSNPLEFEYTSALKVQYPYIAYRLWASRVSSFDNLTVYPMICTKAEWDISQVYVPYCKTNTELANDTSTLFTENTRQETEIGVVANAGAKNLLPMTHTNGSITRYGVTCAWDSNSGTMTLNGAHSSGDSAAIFEFYDGSAEDTKILPAGSYVLTGCPAGGSTSSYRAVLSQITGAVDVGNGVNFELSEPHYAAYRILISGNVEFNNMVFKPMLRPAAITDPTFQPFARTNRELTVLTDEDRASLVDIVDNGDKNLLENSAQSTGIATVNLDGSVTINGSQSTDFSLILSNTLVLDAGTYVMSAGTAMPTSTFLTITIEQGGTQYSISSSTDEGYVRFTLTEKTNIYRVYIWVAKNKTINDLTIKPMICTEAAWKISQTYQPHRPSYQELSDDVDSLENGSFVGIELQSGDNLNNLSRGRYYCRSATISEQILNNPNTGSGFVLDHMYNVGNVVQMLYPSSSSNTVIYKRSYASSSWRPWCKFEGTEVT